MKDRDRYYKEKFGDSPNILKIRHLLSIKRGLEQEAPFIEDYEKLNVKLEDIEAEIYSLREKEDLLIRDPHWMDHYN